MAASTEETEIYTGPNGEQRVKNGEVVIPIVTGTIAQQLPKSKGLPGEATHKWVFYVRSPQGHDLSVLIRKVTVLLHSSFANPKREFTNPPYEVEEAGWGEFEIAIVLSLHACAQCDDIELTHRLKLFQDAVGTVLTKNKQVVFEQYEELVVFEPTVEFYNMSKVAPRMEPAHAAIDPTCFVTFDEVTELKKINAARQKVASISGQIKAQLDGGGDGGDGGGGGEAGEGEAMVEG